MNEQDQVPLPVVHVIGGFDLGGTEGQFVELLRRLDRVRFPAVVMCLSTRGMRLAQVRALGIEPEPVPLAGSFARPATLARAQRLARRARSAGAGVIHSHDLYSNLLAALAARLCGARLLVSRRDIQEGPTLPLSLGLRAAMRAADLVLANAEAVRRLLASRDGVPAEKIAVVHNGVDLAALDARARLPPSGPLPPADLPWVVQVANMHGPAKGHPELLLACARAVRPWRLVLCGTGAHRPALERRAAELGLSRRVSFLGSRPDVPAILARARVAVLASHAEGLPNGVLEAMALGLPVVATTAGGTPELVAEGETGFLVAPGDVDALGARIQALVDDPVRALRMGWAGRRRVLERFTSGRMAREVEALYLRLRRRAATNPSGSAAAPPHPLPGSPE